jgi:hypothetical protein
MTSAYPASLDSFATTRVDATPMVTTHAADHDNANDAINKIEAELGVLPKGVYADVTTRLAAIETPTINAQTGTTYTLVLADASKIVSMSNAAGNTLTIPLNATAAFPVGTQITLRQAGAGQTTVAVTGGGTLMSRGSAFKLAGQYAYATLTKVGTDAWELAGDISV